MFDNWVEAVFLASKETEICQLERFGMRVQSLGSSSFLPNLLVVLTFNYICVFFEKGLYMSSANFYNVYIIYMVFDESRAELRSPSSPVARRIRIPVA